MKPLDEMPMTSEACINEAVEALRCGYREKAQVLAFIALSMGVNLVVRELGGIKMALERKPCPCGHE